jgi:imidazolonepropionase-like amidohydrolase
MGTVERGKDADLVLLDANPLDAVQNLHAIHAVVRAGQYYDSDDLEALRVGVRNRGGAAP